MSFPSALRSTRNPLPDQPRAASVAQAGEIAVNTSRGGLIDEAAQPEAVQSSRVSGAGLGVLEHPDPDYARSVLMQVPDQVVITPDVGWPSEEAILDLQRMVVLDVHELLTHGKPIYQL